MRLVHQPELGRQLVVVLSQRRVAGQLVGLAQVDVQGGQKLGHSLGVGQSRMVQGHEVPTEGRSGIGLQMPHVMGGDAALVVVAGGVPGLGVQPAGVVDAALELGLNAGLGEGEGGGRHGLDHN